MKIKTKIDTGRIRKRQKIQLIILNLQTLNSKCIGIMCSHLLSTHCVKPFAGPCISRGF